MSKDKLNSKGKAVRKKLRKSSPNSMMGTTTRGTMYAKSKSKKSARKA